MRHYEKRASTTHNRMANTTLVDYEKLKTELEVTQALLSSLADNYERLICDIGDGKPFKIDGREFEVREVVCES